jgi:hypothetical protein
VLFSDVTNWNGCTVEITDANTKNAFRQENSFGVMAERSMAKVREERLRFIKPTVDRKVVLGLAAKFLGAAFGVLKWMSHGYTS